MSKSVTLATIQILIDEENPKSAADQISNLFAGEGTLPVIDWSYLRVGSQFLYPIDYVIDENYKEGDFLVRG